MSSADADLVHESYLGFAGQRDVYDCSSVDCRTADTSAVSTDTVTTQAPHRLLVRFVILVEIDGACQRRYQIAYSLIAPFILAVLAAAVLMRRRDRARGDGPTCLNPALAPSTISPPAIPARRWDDRLRR